jgi:hypothetical protein
MKKGRWVDCEATPLPERVGGGVVATHLTPSAAHSHPCSFACLWWCLWLLAGALAAGSCSVGMEYQPYYNPGDYSGPAGYQCQPCRPGAPPVTLAGWGEGASSASESVLDNSVFPPVFGVGGGGQRLIWTGVGS